jgi:hypothetical protein
MDGNDGATHALAVAPSSQTKIFSFFKAKKTPSQQYVNTAGLGAGQGGTLQANSASSTLVRSNASATQPTQASYGPYGGGPTTNGRYPSTDGYGRTGLGSDPRTLATVGAGGAGVEVFETAQQASYQQSAYASAPTSSTRGFYTGSEIAAAGSSSLQGQGAIGYKSLGQGQGLSPTDHFAFQQQQMTNVTGYADASLRTGGLVGDVTGGWTSNTAANGTITPSTTYAHGNGTYQDPRSTMSSESRRAAMMQRTGQSSFDDRLPALSERRNSLPSIVKTRADVAASTAAGPGTRFRGTAVAGAAAGANAATAAGGKVNPKNATGKGPQVDTFVIENGVRRRVRYELLDACMCNALELNAGTYQSCHQLCHGCS